MSKTDQKRSDDDVECKYKDRYAFGERMQALVKNILLTFDRIYKAVD
jgi:hypothetical protein